jgi:orotate phosphoribosyltransferase
MIVSTLESIIRPGPESALTGTEISAVLQASRAVYVDTHVEVVSGHHTGTYLRFDSIAEQPELVDRLAQDMAQWISRRFQDAPVAGLLAPNSAAAQLARRTAALLEPRMRLRVALTSYDERTGRIGTDLCAGTVNKGERFIALNDVTTRGNCVSKLGTVITGADAALAGMMVFARRDSGQFPLVPELIARYPFFYTVDLAMPQWEPQDCPLCRAARPLISWRDLPKR